MSGLQPQATGYFVNAATGARTSHDIKCMDVLDSFPCLTCGAGLHGNNLRCRNERQRCQDLDVLASRRSAQS